MVFSTRYSPTVIRLFLAAPKLFGPLRPGIGLQGQQPFDDPLMHLPWQSANSFSADLFRWTT